MAVYLTMYTAIFYFLFSLWPSLYRSYLYDSCWQHQYPQLQTASTLIFQAQDNEVLFQYHGCTYWVIYQLKSVEVTGPRSMVIELGCVGVRGIDLQSPCTDASPSMQIQIKGLNRMVIKFPKKPLTFHRL